MPGLEDEVVMMGWSLPDSPPGVFSPSASFGLPPPGQLSIEAEGFEESPLNAARARKARIRRSFTESTPDPEPYDRDLEEPSEPSFSSQPDAGETRHEWLQRSLSFRRGGGPIEQTRSGPFRLRSTRCCDIVHSNLQEPLASYKKLEPLRPYEQCSKHRFHEKHGFTVCDNDTIIVPARDRLEKTRKGLLRTSSGTVTYSHTHRVKAELDIEEICRIVCNEGIPGGGRYWSPKKLERVFKERTGRSGIWITYEVPFRRFLELFPKTFELINDGQQIVLQKQRAACQDDIEDVIMRLAVARDKGFVQQHLGTAAAATRKAEQQDSMRASCPDLMRHRFRAAYAPFD